MGNSTVLLLMPFGLVAVAWLIGKATIRLEEAEVPRATEDGREIEREKVACCRACAERMKS